MPKRILEPDLPDCQAGCENRNLRNAKVSSEAICMKDLRVASVFSQIVICDTCGEEFSYQLSAKYNCGRKCTKSQVGEPIIFKDIDPFDDIFD